ncbi:MAG: hypothetical protein ACI965_000880 [Paraglaciecola sp.]
MTTPTKSNSKRTMLILATVFIVPVLLAKLALEYNWFNNAATNRGELISPALDMRPLQASAADKKWQLIYLLPADCQADCENALYSLAQVWTALGRKSDRVEALVIVTELSDKLQLKTLSEQSIIRVFSTEQSSVKQVFEDTPTEGIFIADTLSNVILRYAPQREQEQAVLHSRDILRDMKKLLKLSRIG